MTNDNLIEDIKTESTNIQTEFIMKLIRLCEKYGVDKTTFIRDTTKTMYEFTLTSNFNQLSSE